MNSENSKKVIWIDIYNSPHVPFFKPIIKKLEERGYKIFISSRDCAQVSSLSRLLDIPYFPIGRHSGKVKILKAMSVLWRAVRLYIYFKRKKVDLALAHGSRSQLVAANLLKIPTVEIMDYEHTMGVLSFKPDWMIIPQIVSPESFQAGSGILQYPGIKEDVYVQSFRPDSSLLRTLNIATEEILVSIRPPATEAHYHNHAADKLFEYIVEYLGKIDHLRLVILPRYESQENDIRRKWKKMLRAEKLIIPKDAVDGLNLIWFSDFVISGGGTMNREAAALGVPVYSIFMGEIGAVDRYLEKEKKLVFLKSIDDINQKMAVERREKPQKGSFGDGRTIDAIISNIEQIVSFYQKRIDG